MMRPVELLFAALLLASCVAVPAHAADDDSALFDYLHELQSEFPPEGTLEKIYSRNGILYCTGSAEAADANNRAAGLMEAGDYAEAASELGRALKHAPLFFPFHYNHGICDVYLSRLRAALIHFEKARMLVPEYSKTSLQIGYIYDRWGKDGSAIDNYTEAIRKNPKELEAYVLIGDIYFKRKQLAMAARYYEQSLGLDPRYPNGLLGMAKIHFEKEEYFKALVLIKSIDRSRTFDRSLHYYHAECSYKLKDYRTAYEQYRILLTYRNDRFFLVNSAKLIEHKMNLSKRFVDQFESGEMQ